MLQLIQSPIAIGAVPTEEASLAEDNPAATSPIP
jgi:hypothetical protein